MIYLRNYKKIYCFFVLILLILPLIYISKDNVSKQENRVLNKFPSLYTEGKINKKYGIEFNSWFSDRFGFRKQLIDLRLLILYKINNKIANYKAFKGDDGWLFPSYTINVVPHIVEKKEFEAINTIKKFNNGLKDKNVQIYLVIDPDRNALYRKYWEKYYPNTVSYKYFENLKKEFSDSKNIHLITLDEIFEKNKDKFQLYKKSDPHMNISAMNLMTEKIISELGGSNLEEYCKKHFFFEDCDCNYFKANVHYNNVLRTNTVEIKAKCKHILTSNSKMKYIQNNEGINEAIVENPYYNKDLYIIFPCYEVYIFPVLGELFRHTISVNYDKYMPGTKSNENYKNSVHSFLKSIRQGSIILIYITNPQVDSIFNTMLDYLEVF